MTQGTDYEGAMISAALDLGFAVVVTDYEGLGTPGPHTYMVGQSQGRAVLDIVRAAQRLPGTGLSTQAPVGIMGYSQGGAGAGWAAQLAPSYAPELQVRGAAMGGVPSDLTRVANFLEGTPYMGFALMASLGLDAAYPDLDLNSYLNARGRDLKNQASSVCLVSVDGFATFLQTAFTRFSDYTTTNPLDAPAWQARLGQQLLGGSAPTVPVYQYHGELDQIIPLDQAETLRNAWCAQGVNLTWKTVPLTEHLTAMVAGYPEALTWMGLTLAGAPSTSTC